MWQWFSWITIVWIYSEPRTYCFLWFSVIQWDSFHQSWTCKSWKTVSETVVWNSVVGKNSGEDTRAPYCMFCAHPQNIFTSIKRCCWEQKPTSSFGWLLYAANLCTKSWWHRVLHSQQGVLPGLLADLCSRYWKICCYLMLARLELASKCLPMLQLHCWKSECPKALTNAREILYINNSISSLTADKIVTMAIYVLSWPMW